MLRENDTVEIKAEQTAGRWQARALSRTGRVIRVRNDGMVVVLWDGLVAPQLFHPDLLAKS